MKYAAVKAVAAGLIAGAAALLLAGYLLLGQGHSHFSILLIAVGVLFAAALFVIAVWGRCPHCGRHLIWGFFRHTECPQCGKRLDS